MEGWMTDIVERLRQHGSDVSNWAADEIERLSARRAVVCGTCQGGGKVRNFHGDLPSSFPYDCPDCGKDGCGAGVRWSDG